MAESIYVVAAEERTSCDPCGYARPVRDTTERGEGSCLPQFLQYFDTAFPIGAFTHPFGHESVLLDEDPNDPSYDTLRSWLTRNVRTMALVADIPVLLIAYHSLEDRRTNSEYTDALTELSRLNAALHTSRTARESRAATAQVGRQAGRVARSLWPSPLLDAFVDQCTVDDRPSELAVLTAILASTLRWDPISSATAYLHTSLRTSVTAARRVIPLGELAAQRIIDDVRGSLPSPIEEVRGVQEADFFVTDLYLERAAMRHEQLPGRMFLS